MSDTSLKIGDRVGVGSGKKHGTIVGAMNNKHIVVFPAPTEYQNDIRSLSEEEMNPLYRVEVLYKGGKTPHYLNGTRCFITNDVNQAGEFTKQDAEKAWEFFSETRKAICNYLEVHEIVRSRI